MSSEHTKYEVKCEELKDEELEETAQFISTIIEYRNRLKEHASGNTILFVTGVLLSTPELTRHGGIDAAEKASAEQREPEEGDGSEKNEGDSFDKGPPEVTAAAVTKKQAQRAFGTPIKITKNKPKVYTISGGKSRSTELSPLDEQRKRAGEWDAPNI